MTWRLDAPVRAGSVWLAAVVRQEVGARVGSGSIGCWGTRRAFLILVLAEGRLSGFDIAGSRLDEAAVEQHFPSAPAQFRAMVAGRRAFVPGG